MLDLLSQWTKGEKSKQRANPEEKAIKGMQFNNNKKNVHLSVSTMEIREMNTSLKNKIEQVFLQFGLRLSHTSSTNSIKSSLLLLYYSIKSSKPISLQDFLHLSLTSCFF